MRTVLLVILIFMLLGHYPCGHIAPDGDTTQVTESDCSSSS
jgi:hypothetical protein